MCVIIYGTGGEEQLRNTRNTTIKKQARKQRKLSVICYIFKLLLIRYKDEELKNAGNFQLKSIWSGEENDAHMNHIVHFLSVVKWLDNLIFEM